MPQTIIETNVTMEPTDPQNSNKSKETSEQFLKRLTESPLETQVEELAALFFTIEQIADFTGLEEDALRESLMADDDIAKAYRRGKLRTVVQLRFDALNYALHGSPQAAAEMKEYLSEQTIHENA